MAEIKVDSELDCSGLLCPMPIVKLKDALMGIKPGQVLKMTATDPGSRTDVPAFCRRTGHELLMAGEEGGKFAYNLKRRVE